MIRPTLLAVAGAAILLSIAAAQTPERKETSPPPRQETPPPERKQTPPPIPPEESSAERLQTPAPEPPPLPAPSRRPLAARARPDRAERAERLRAIGGRALDVLGAVAGQDTNAPPLDPNQLNAGVAAMLEPLARPDGALESIELRVDPEGSNLARDRVTLVGSSRMRYTRWSPEPSSLDVAVTAQVTPPGDGPREARIDGEAHLSTNVIALANYALPKFAERMTAPPDERLSGPADAIIKQRVAEKLSRVGEITSLDDLADVFTHVTALRMMTLNEEVERLRAVVDAEPDNREAATRLHEARLERDRQFDSRPTIERNPSGAVEAIHIVMNSTQPLNGSRVDRYDVRVTDREIAVSIGGTSRDGVAIYTVAKPAVVRMLARIQARDPEAIDLERGIVGGVVRHWIDEIAGPPPRPLP